MLAASPARDRQPHKPMPGDIVDCIICRGTGTLTLTYEHDCPRCRGTGETTITRSKCPICCGSGRPVGSLNTCRICQGSGWVNKLM